MTAQLLERKLPVETEDFTRSFPFVQFVETTAPKTKNTPLPRLAQSIVYRLSCLCQPDQYGNSAVIRGGSMRSFLFDNYVTDERFAGLFENVNPQLLGENPLAKQVVDKVFSLPKDIDIFLRSLIFNNIAHDSNLLFLALAYELTHNNGFIALEQNGNGDERVFINGQYQVRLFRHHTGVNHRQTLVKVDMSQGNQVLLKLHFGLIPTNEERKEDPRFYDEAADIDQVALGNLSRSDNEQIMMKYVVLGEESFVRAYLRKHFFDPLQHPFEVDPAKKPDQIISARLREINFRVALISWLFSIKGIVGIDADLQQTPYYDLFMKYALKYKKKFTSETERMEFRQWFQNNHHSVKDHFKLIASDAMYGLTVNPFLFFLFAFPTNVLDAFPLGEKIDLMPVMHFLGKLTQKIGGDFGKDSLLTLSMKYYNYLRTAQDSTIFQLLEFFEMPQNFSEFLKLINMIS